MHGSPLYYRGGTTFPLTPSLCITLIMYHDWKGGGGGMERRWDGGNYVPPLVYMVVHLLRFSFLLGVGYAVLSQIDFSNALPSSFVMLASKTPKMKPLAPLYAPRSPNQFLYKQALENSNKTMTVALGPAGSGKTLFACMTAILALKKGDIQKIIITRPLISVEEEQIGFLPGSLVSKMDPWTRPMFDVFQQFYSVADLHNFIKQGIIEIAPLAFMRGRTFHRAFVLADEMQNSSPNQMFMLTTRIGMESKLVVTGDLEQSDRIENNGLRDLLLKLNHTNDHIDLIQMQHSDVFRSPFVAEMLRLYQ